MFRRMCWSGRWKTERHSASLFARATWLHESVNTETPPMRALTLKYHNAQASFAVCKQRTNSYLKWDRLSFCNVTLSLLFISTPSSSNWCCQELGRLRSNFKRRTVPCTSLQETAILAAERKEKRSMEPFLGRWASWAGPHAMRLFAEWCDFLQ